MSPVVFHSFACELVKIATPIDGGDSGAPRRGDVPTRDGQYQRGSKQRAGQGGLVESLAPEQAVRISGPYAIQTNDGNTVDSGKVEG